MSQKPRCLAVFGPHQALSLKARLLSLLKEELGLGSQPKVVRLLVDELFETVDQCYQAADAVRPGQLVVLVPRRGSGSGRHTSMQETPLVRVRLTLVGEEDIQRLATGMSPLEVRITKLCRMIRETFDQGGTMSIAHLALITGLHYSTVRHTLTAHAKKTGEMLPLRGIVEHMGPAVSHKGAIIAWYLKGLTTSEIARKTQHSPSSIERYVRRFNQIRELLPYLEEQPDYAVIARIVNCSIRLVKIYVALARGKEEASQNPPLKPSRDP